MSKSKCDDNLLLDAVNRLLATPIPERDEHFAYATQHAQFTAPRRAFVHYDNSDSVIDCSVEPSKTLQSEKDACDINNIVARAAAGQFIDHVMTREGHWGIDVSGVSDYQSALNFVNAANTQFMELPANIRARFQNNPAEFLAFIDNPDNLEEGRKLGIFKPEMPPATPPAKPSEAPAGGAADAPKGAS